MNKEDTLLHFLLSINRKNKAVNNAYDISFYKLCECVLLGYCSCKACKEFVEFAKSVVLGECIDSFFTCSGYLIVS